VKKLQFIFLFLIPVLAAHAQQPPPPKNPKDPDSATQINPLMKVVEIGPQAIFTAVEHEPVYPGG
jgi:hypothetical protein